MPVREYWVEADARDILGPEGQVVAQKPDLNGFTDAELGIVAYGAKRIDGTDWWHCSVAINKGTEDWTGTYNKLDAMAVSGRIKTDSAELPTDKAHARQEATGIAGNGDPIIEQKMRSIQELAARHSFGNAR